MAWRNLTCHSAPKPYRPFTISLNNIAIVLISEVSDKPILPSCGIALLSQNNKPPFEIQCMPDFVSNGCITNDLHPIGNLIDPLDTYEVE